MQVSYLHPQIFSVSGFLHQILTLLFFNAQGMYCKNSKNVKILTKSSLVKGMQVAGGIRDNFYGLLKMKSCVNAEQNESITMRKNENG